MKILKFYLKPQLTTRPISGNHSRKENFLLLSKLLSKLINSEMFLVGLEERQSKKTVCFITGEKEEGKFVVLFPSSSAELRRTGGPVRPKTRVARRPLP